MNKKQLQQLYNQGKSIAEIATLLQCSSHKIVYWMKKHRIKRRSRSDAMYIKYNPQGDPFNIKKNLTSADMFLLGLGLGIYWGEGTKVSRHSVRVSNTDPAMLKVFIRFLKNICTLKPEKISYSIICFNDSDIKKVKQFWSQHMKTSPDKFGTIVTIPPQGEGTYRKKSQHGVCTVTVGNVKLKTWIMDQIEKLRKMPG